jgi:hypothetical protein
MNTKNFDDVSHHTPGLSQAKAHNANLSHKILFTEDEDQNLEFNAAEEASPEPNQLVSNSNTVGNTIALHLPDKETRREFHDQSQQFSVISIPSLENQLKEEELVKQEIREMHDVSMQVSIFEKISQRSEMNQTSINIQTEPFLNHELVKESTYTVPNLPL